METTTRKPQLQKIPVYEVRLVQARRSLRLAEPTVSDAALAGRTMHAMLGLTDREDSATTAKLMAAGRVLGIPVLDHIIVTRDSRRWHSMASRGTLPPEP